MCAFYILRPASRCRHTPSCVRKRSHTGVCVCVSKVTQITHTHTLGWSLPSAYVIFSSRLWLKAVLVEDEGDLGKHSADILALAKHFMGRS